MFFLLGNDKAEKTKKNMQISSVEKVKELFKLGRFPVVTTQEIADRKIAKVLGLVCCRGYDADEAFYGMAAMAQNKGGQAIIAYSENIAFHPDGSKFFSCFGTAVVFERESRDVRDNFSTSFEKNNEIPSVKEYVQQNYVEDDTEELLNLIGNQQMSEANSVEEDFSMTNMQETSKNANNINKFSQQKSMQTSHSIKNSENSLINPISEEEDPVLQRLLAQKQQRKKILQ